MVVALFAGLVGLTVAEILVRPGTARLPLGALLVAQTFAVSSGAFTSARLGHYDGLLARGIRREVIAFGHWLACAVPGLLAWIVVALLGGSPRVIEGHHAVSSGSVLALWLASTIPWAATMSLPRYTGALLWLVIATGVDDVWGPLGDLGPGQLPSAWVALVDPLSLIGRRVDPEPARLWPAVVCSVGAVVAAVAWFCRVDLSLEANP
jgi:hypothetical protein